MEKGSITIGHYAICMLARYPVLRYVLAAGLVWLWYKSV